MVALHGSGGGSSVRNTTSARHLLLNSHLHGLTPKLLCTVHTHTAGQVTTPKSEIIMFGGHSGSNIEK